MSSKILRKYINLIIESTEFVMADEGDELEEDQIKVTFGDFKNFLYKNKKAKTTKKVLRFFANVGLGSAISGIVDGLNLTNIDSLKDISSETLEQTVADKLKDFTPDNILKKLYGINNAVGIEHFSIPSEISVVVDDKIENAFLEYLLKSISNEPDDKVVTKGYTIDKWNTWLSKNYSAIVSKK